MNDVSKIRLDPTRQLLIYAHKSDEIITKGLIDASFQVSPVADKHLHLITSDHVDVNLIYDFEAEIWRMFSNVGPDHIVTLLSTSHLDYHERASDRMLLDWRKPPRSDFHIFVGHRVRRIATPSKELP